MLGCLACLRAGKSRERCWVAIVALSILCCYYAAADGGFWDHEWEKVRVGVEWVGMGCGSRGVFTEKTREGSSLAAALQMPHASSPARLQHGTCARAVTGERQAYFDAAMRLHEQYDLDVSANASGGRKPPCA